MILALYGSLDHFGLGLYCTRVRQRTTGHRGMRFSIYFLFWEAVLIFDLGDDE